MKHNWHSLWQTIHYCTCFFVRSRYGTTWWQLEMTIWAGTWKKLRVQFRKYFRRYRHVNSNRCPFWTFHMKVFEQIQLDIYEISVSDEIQLDMFKFGASPIWILSTWKSKFGLHKNTLGIYWSRWSWLPESTL